MTTTPESVLAELPGWEEASWRELDGCVTNQPYLVEAGGRRAVLKIDEVPRDLPFNSRPIEAKIQKSAEQAGLAARVLHVSDTVLMTEYIDGVIWSLDCLDDNANLESLAVALKKMHSLPLTGRTFDTMGAAREYAKDIDESKAGQIEESIQITKIILSM